MTELRQSRRPSRIPVERGYLLALANLEVLGNAVRRLVEKRIVTENQVLQAIAESGATAGRSRFLKNEARRLGVSEEDRISITTMAAAKTDRLVLAPELEGELSR